MELGLQISVGMLIAVLFLRLLRPTITMQNKVVCGEKLASLEYTDESGGKLLVAESLDLQGKPDYIFKKWLTKKYIPFEIKSTKLKEDMPHEGDLMQLVAYFLIIEEVYGTRPPYGRLVYKNKSFKVRNTHALRTNLKATLNEMQGMLEGKCNQVAEPSFIKCKNCVCQQTVCEWYQED